MRKGYKKLEGSRDFVIDTLGNGVYSLGEKNGNERGTFMSHYELIGFDMDGTILNSQKTISHRTLEAVNRAARMGKRVILSTGRCISELEEFREDRKSVV